MRGPGDDAVKRLARLALLLLLLRLLAWAFLLPAWAGFDEPYHHGLVESCAAEPRWYPFLGVALPERLMAATRRWPAPGPARASFTAQGQAGGRLPEWPILNYETLQSPAYYFLAGALLREIPPLDPIHELYLLRVSNALLAFAVGWLTLVAARLAGFGPAAALPVLLLALLPGYAVALVRVSNDAACALLVSIALALAVRGKARAERRGLTAAVAGGLAPWAKLYGWAAVPKLAFDAARERPWTPRSAARLGWLVLPGAALAYFSWRIHGHPISLLENLSHPGAPRFFEVPWLRDFWTIVKTQIWVSGRSTIVFPTPLYVVLAAALAALLAATLHDRRTAFLPDLAVPIASFCLALAYFCYRNFALYRGPGGTGGWYLWAMALPESLLLTAAAARGGWPSRLLGALLPALLVLTAAGDAVLFAEPSGRLLVTQPTHHIRGLAPGPLAELLPRFLASRPLTYGVLALAFSAASWVVAARCLTERPRILSWTPNSLRRSTISSSDAESPAAGTSCGTGGGTSPPSFANASRPTASAP